MTISPRPRSRRAAPSLATLALRARRERWENLLEAQIRATLRARLESLGLTLRREVVFSPARKWRFDFALRFEANLADGIVAAMPFLAIEVEGGVWTNGRHTRGAGFEEDARKYGEAVVLGWRVLRVTPDMVKSGEALRLVERALALAPISRAFGPGEIAERSSR